MSVSGVDLAQHSNYSTRYFAHWDAVVNSIERIISCEGTATLASNGMEYMLPYTDENGTISINSNKLGYTYYATYPVSVNYLSAVFKYTKNTD